ALHPRRAGRRAEIPREVRQVHDVYLSIQVRITQEREAHLGVAVAQVDRAQCAAGGGRENLAAADLRLDTRQREVRDQLVVGQVDLSGAVGGERERGRLKHRG